MRMIGCVSPATSGTLDIFGLNAATQGRQIRGRLGVVPQLDTLDKELSVMENLVLYGRYFDIPRGRVPATAPPNCSSSSNSVNEPTASSTS